ncbi:MAG: hypothetical protein CWE10_13485 [Symbiobacterium thermophilum]|uniref:Uncharacterized protein n=1 Tax=Symbiobacterium thermophilum TaxID=2734 RepID=A0A953I586_SYMTR|nr:hypothetical protein [Symbiobacterium thermophilum]
MPELALARILLNVGVAPVGRESPRGRDVARQQVGDLGEAGRIHDVDAVPLPRAACRAVPAGAPEQQPPAVGRKGRIGDGQVQTPHRAQAGGVDDRQAQRHGDRIEPGQIGQRIRLDGPQGHGPGTGRHGQKQPDRASGRAGTRRLRGSAPVHVCGTADQEQGQQHGGDTSQHRFHPPPQ